MRRRYYTGRDATYAYSIEDLERMARRRLPNFAYEYITGGAGSEVTLADNRLSFESLRWSPRTLVDVSQIYHERVLFDHKWLWPMGIAPTGYNGMLWPDADILLAQVAENFDLPFTLSTVSCNSLEQIRENAPGVRLWFQLYSLKDREVEERLFERALKAKCEALVVTTDAVVLGDRHWDKRNFSSPGRLTWRNKLDVVLHAGWMCRVLWPHGMPSLGNLTEFLPVDQQSALGAAQFIGHQMNRALDRETLVSLRERWPNKLIVKGILNSQDAKMCAELGVDGIVVSNHGGRQVDGAPAPIAQVSDIRSVVGDDMVILLDSGIRHGADILKAIALGADGALTGRATLYGVAAAGRTGAWRAIALLTAQIENTLAVIGCPDLNELNCDWVLNRCL